MSVQNTKEQNPDMQAADAAAENGTQQERPIEEVFAELEDILNWMQDPEVTLQETFSLYEKGVQDIKLCDTLLDRIEKKMLELNRDGSAVPFETDDMPLPFN